MRKRREPGKLKILVPVAVAACIAVMVLSAVAASLLYRPNGDAFTESLGKNLAVLCSNSDCGLSGTQLSMITNARVRSVRYDSGSGDEKLFYAKLEIPIPGAAAGTYSDNPEDYLLKSTEGMRDSRSSETCEIIGLCRDNAPVVDMETLDVIADTARKAWEKEQLSTDTDFEYALTDYIIPEPFPDRVFSTGKGYQAIYEKWLDECAEQFASEGMTVTANGSASDDAADIRAAMEEVITPYFCSVRNISLSRNSDKSGYLTLSFDSLDVIGTLSTAGKPSIEGLNKLCGVYSDDRALKVSIDIDISELTKGKGRFALPFYNVIRAITRYGSSIGTERIKIKIPTSSQVIAGKSDGQWPVEFKRTKGDGNVIVNVLRIDDSGAETSVLKLFLTDGGKITVCLSKGSYRLHTAVGTTYYGSKEIFGANGIYIRDPDNVFTLPSKDLKSITIAKHPAESLSFRDYLLRQGVDSSLIDQSQF